MALLRPRNMVRRLTMVSTGRRPIKDNMAAPGMRTDF
jgi:hypothetical protein